MLSSLFWQYYPRMFARFADLSGTASDVIHAIENDGYAVAETSELLERYPVRDIVKSLENSGV